MNDIIGEAQMAFVEKRQIIDSFVIANEVISSWKKEKEGGILLKLDFEKAYDSVDHKFLDLCLQGMGFGEKWRGWVSSVVASPLMSILVNGSPTKEFQVGRGLRQGDPISPFLFNIVIEALNKMLVKARERNLFRGKVFGRNGTHITHLQFADDTLIFVDANVDSVVNLRRILRFFEVGSGLKINFHKSVLVRVGKRYSAEERWASLFRCKEDVLPINYLGLPLGGNPNSISFWEPLINKFRSRLAPWKTRFISKAGRLVLIKSVLSSLPTYYLSVFKIPKAVALELEKFQRNFFWGAKGGKKGIHWVDWETLCNNRRSGGLGIGRISDKNDALLAKWVWRFGVDGDVLWKKVLCNKYLLEPNSLLWDWNGGASASIFVNSIRSLWKENSITAGILFDHVHFLLGDGRNLKFWSDIKFNDVSLQDMFPRIYALAANKRGVVGNFGEWLGNEWRWNIALRRPVFGWEEEIWLHFLSSVRKLKLRKSCLDSIVWSLTPSGIFSVCSFRREIEFRKSNSVVIQKNPLVWCGVVPPKVDLFLWSIAKNRLMVGELLPKFTGGLVGSFSCPFCNSSEESINHLFLACKWTWRIWAECMSWWDILACLPGSIGELMECWVELCPDAMCRRAWVVSFHATVWSIWEMRNEIIFNQGTADFVKVKDMVRWRIAWWFKNCGKRSQLPVSYLMLNLKAGCVDFPKVVSKVGCLWCPPMAGALKFNVDGASRGNPGPSGIGGILRNFKGEILCLFSANVGFVQAIEAEVLAILSACRLCLSVNCPSGLRISIESDSKVAVAWVNGKNGVGNICFMDYILDIKEILKNCSPRLTVKFISRSGNMAADFLAKQGAASMGSQEAWA